MESLTPGNVLVSAVLVAASVGVIFALSPDESDILTCAARAGIEDVDAVRAANGDPDNDMLRVVWSDEPVSYNTLTDSRCSMPGSASALSIDDWQRIEECAASLRVRPADVDAARRAPRDRVLEVPWGDELWSYYEVTGQECRGAGANE